MYCFQETKLNSITYSLLREIMGNSLDSRGFILVDGTAGGVILVWRSAIFTEVNHMILSYVVTIDLKHNLDNTMLRVIGVYGPAISVNRNLFFFVLMQSKPN
jgi:hypothetical protein